MEFTNPTAEVFAPDGLDTDEALKRVTHLAIGAHQDDLEIMAYHGILQCFGSQDNWFGGVIVTNGSGSPRDDLYADYTDEQMQVVRRKEQKKAAVVGEYGAAILLDYPSSAAKDPSRREVVGELMQIISAARPSVIYTHNLADKHDTHVAVTLRTIAALREMPNDAWPKEFYGCEVWRDLDWMADEDKAVFDVGAHESLAVALLGVFDSQDCGGKRYDLATMGRRCAHATYHESHGVDVTTGMTFAMDMMPLLADPSLDPMAHVQAHIDRFTQEVQERLKKIGGA